MAKKKTIQQIDGQLTIFDFCVDSSNYVTQSNEIIKGKQSLSLNAAKLLRSAIMQTKPNDTELKPYVLTVPELAKLLNVTRQDIHKKILEITQEITKSPLCIKEENGDKTRWVLIPWVSICKYDPEIGILIKLNEQLKPLLLNLISQGNYTQYTLDSILTMKSVYAIRIFELLREKIKSKTIPQNGILVELTIDEIRTACDCIDKLKSFTSFREKVIEKAISEINEKTTYIVKYADIKQGRSINAFLFNVNMNYH